MVNNKSSNRFDLSKVKRSTWIWLGVFLILAVIGAIAAYTLSFNIFKSMTVLNLPGAPVIQNVAAPGSTAQPTQNIQSGPTSVPWDGHSRINILLLGLDYNDYHDVATDTAFHSDSMMVVTIDPVSMTAGMLSIPRDMWVDVPGYDHYKINTAYYLGEINKLPGGGPALAVKTVEEFLGVPINYYIQIKFNAFVKLIDTIGGVVITPPQDIKIEAMYSNQKEVPLTGGKSYTLDGSLALAYARNRKSTANGDFDRAQRQQEVIMAIRNRIIAYKSMPMLIAKSSEIYAELSDGIATNLSLEQLMQLGQLALQIDPQKIAKAVISPQDAPPTLANLPDGTSTAIDQPVPDRIRALRDKVFASSPTSAEVLVSNDTLILAKQEGARISLQNGSSSGSVSASTATYLGQQGLTISEQKAADHAYPSTTLVIYNSKPYTLKYLANLFQVPSNRILYRYDPASSVDIGLIIGEDWAKNNTLPK